MPRSGDRRIKIDSGRNADVADGKRKKYSYDCEQPTAHRDIKASSVFERQESYVEFHNFFAWAISIRVSELIT